MWGVEEGGRAELVSHAGWGSAHGGGRDGRECALLGSSRPSPPAPLQGGRGHHQNETKNLSLSVGSFFWGGGESRGNPR